MRSIPLVLPILLLVLTGMSSVFMARADQEVQVKAEVNNAFITIGDKIEFKVTLIHPAHTRMVDIDTSDALSDFEIKSEKDFSQKEKDLVREGKIFTITNYALGDYVIRPVRIQYKTSSGEIQATETNQLYVTVKSVDATQDSKNDIKGIKGVLNIKAKIWPWILVLTLLMLGLGAYGFWHAYKKGKASGLAAAPQMSPQDEAYLALSHLQNSDLLRRKEYKIYFFQLSEILRHYFERRFQVHALESTTFEILVVLKDQLSSNQRKLIDSVLSFCDLVKFAKWIPEPNEIIQMNKTAKEIIDATKKEEILPAAFEPDKPLAT